MDWAIWVINPVGSFKSFTVFLANTATSESGSASQISKWRWTEFWKTPPSLTKQTHTEHTQTESNSKCNSIENGEYVHKNGEDYTQGKHWAIEASLIYKSNMKTIKHDQWLVSLKGWRVKQMKENYLVPPAPPPSLINIILVQNRSGKVVYIYIDQQIKILLQWLKHTKNTVNPIFIYEPTRKSKHWQTFPRFF